MSSKNHRKIHLFSVRPTTDKKKLDVLSLGLTEYDSTAVNFDAIKVTYDGILGASRSKRKLDLVTR